MNAELGPDELEDIPEFVAFDDSSDFQEPIVIPDENNKRKIDDVESEEDEEDVTVCGICQKEWTNNGVHCITQMKCGHCFGRTCINLYKRDNTKNSKFNCPVCGQITTKREIRKIWPTKLFPEEEKYLDSLKSELKELDKRLKELALQNTAVKKDLIENKAVLDNMSPQIEAVPYQTIRDTQSTLPEPRQNRQFSFQSKISMEGEVYNVIDLNPLEDMAVVSTYQSQKRLYGFRKINMYDPSVTEFISTNHQNVIRDIKHSSNGMILSTGDDKTLKLTSIVKNLVVQSYQLSAPSRACSFDDKNLNLLYCGLTTGALMIYDVRNTRNHLSMLVNPERELPVISVMSKGNSIICTDRHSSYVWTSDGSEGEFTARPLHMLDENQEKNANSQDSSTIYSISSTEKAFCTSKSNNGTMKHNINKVVGDSKPLIIKEDWSFTVQQETSSICRNTHFVRNDNVFLCYAEKDFVKIRTKDEQVQAFTTNRPILDIKHTDNGFNEFFATLSRDSLYIHTYNS